MSGRFRILQNCPLEEQFFEEISDIVSIPKCSMPQRQGLRLRPLAPLLRTYCTVIV